jgi:hypothetical protein
MGCPFKNGASGRRAKIGGNADFARLFVAF